VPAAKVFDRIAAPKVPAESSQEIRYFIMIYKVVSPDGIEPSVLARGRAASVAVEDHHDLALRASA
jgi:hypothetical protein